MGLSAGSVPSRVDATVKAGLLDLLGVPYVGSTGPASRRAFDKSICTPLVDVQRPAQIALPNSMFRELGARALMPAIADRPIRRDWRGKHIRLERFAEMARFNYGSTVIVLLPPGVAAFAPALHAESPVKLGQRLATLEG